jgi:hypothetical protein
MLVEPDLEFVYNHNHSILVNVFFFLCVSAQRIKD